MEYKADWYGREIIKIDTLYPSSQICSNCGHKDGKKALSIRE
ncbi:zinc ribbon domain-containing protein [Velocimicrobium porci]